MADKLVQMVSRIDTADLTLNDRLMFINRVAKVMKGGKRLRFSALVVTGDGNGHVGLGIGKANEVPAAINKGGVAAKKNLIKVPMTGSTIPHEVTAEYGAARVMLKPAAPGTGIIAGEAVRAVCEAAGIKNILTKSYGTNNPITIVKATFDALSQLRTQQEIERLRGVSLS